jgi:Ca-activated chloride channel family protein
MRRLFLTLVLLVSATTVFAQTGETSASLTALDAQGRAQGMCPLKHTDVKAEISGFISRVVVTQQFQNPFTEKIEAVYMFPLPQNAAVDDMTMIVGERTVRGRILAREEARIVYEAAKSSGQVAGLLDQERPNIFTQSVANILPGEQVKITISYVETLSYVNGAYELHPENGSSASRQSGRRHGCIAHHSQSGSCRHEKRARHLTRSHA